MRKILILASLLCASAAAESASAQDKAQIDSGAQVYTANCEECHGEGLISHGAVFDLRQLGADERSRFDKALADGKGGQMPAFAGMLSAEEIDQLWAYIRSKAKN
jgi:cytochrome c55X